MFNRCLSLCGWGRNILEGSYSLFIKLWIVRRLFNMEWCDTVYIVERFYANRIVKKLYSPEWRQRDKRFLMKQSNPEFMCLFFQPVPGPPASHGIISQQHRNPGDWIPDDVPAGNAGHTALAFCSPGSPPGFGARCQFCVITCHLAGGISTWAHVLPACHPLPAGCHPLSHSHPQGQCLPEFTLRQPILFLVCLFFPAVNLLTPE